MFTKLHWLNHFCLAALLGGGILLAGPKMVLADNEDACYCEQNADSIVQLLQELESVIAKSSCTIPRPNTSDDDEETEIPTDTINVPIEETSERTTDESDDDADDDDDDEEPCLTVATDAYNSLGDKKGKCVSCAGSGECAVIVGCDNGVCRHSEDIIGTEMGCWLGDCECLVGYHFNDSGKCVGEETTEVTTSIGGEHETNAESDDDADDDDSCLDEKMYYDEEQGICVCVPIDCPDGQIQNTDFNAPETLCQCICNPTNKQKCEDGVWTKWDEDSCSCLCSDDAPKGAKGPQEWLITTKNPLLNSSVSTSQYGCYCPEDTYYDAGEKACKVNKTCENCDTNCQECNSMTGECQNLKNQLLPSGVGRCCNGKTIPATSCCDDEGNEATTDDKCSLGTTLNLEDCKCYCGHTLLRYMAKDACCANNQEMWEQDCPDITEVHPNPNVPTTPITIATGKWDMNACACVYTCKNSTQHYEKGKCVAGNCNNGSSCPENTECNTTTGACEPCSTHCGGKCYTPRQTLACCQDKNLYDPTTQCCASDGTVTTPATGKCCGGDALAEGQCCLGDYIWNAEGLAISQEGTCQCENEAELHQACVDSYGTWETLYGLEDRSKARVGDVGLFGCRCVGAKTVCDTYQCQWKTGETPTCSCEAPYRQPTGSEAVATVEEQSLSCANCVCDREKYHCCNGAIQETESCTGTVTDLNSDCTCPPISQPQTCARDSDCSEGQICCGTSCITPSETLKCCNGQTYNTTTQCCASAGPYDKNTLVCSTESSTPYLSDDGCKCVGCQNMGKEYCSQQGICIVCNEETGACELNSKYANYLEDGCPSYAPEWDEENCQCTCSTVCTAPAYRTDNCGCAVCGPGMQLCPNSGDAAMIAAGVCCPSGTTCHTENNGLATCACPSDMPNDCGDGTCCPHGTICGFGGCCEKTQLRFCNGILTCGPCGDGGGGGGGDNDGDCSSDADCSDCESCSGGTCISCTDAGMMCCDGQCATSCPGGGGDDDNDGDDDEEETCSEKPVACKTACNKVLYTDGHEICHYDGIKYTWYPYPRCECVASSGDDDDDDNEGDDDTDDDEDPCKDVICGDCQVCNANGQCEADDSLTCGACKMCSNGSCIASTTCTSPWVYDSTKTSCCACNLKATDCTGATPDLKSTDTECECYCDTSKLSCKGATPDKNEQTCSCECNSALHTCPDGQTLNTDTCKCVACNTDSDCGTCQKCEKNACVADAKKKGTVCDGACKTCNANGQCETDDTKCTGNCETCNTNGQCEKLETYTKCQELIEHDEHYAWNSQSTSCEGQTTTECQCGCYTWDPTACDNIDCGDCGKCEISKGRTAYCVQDKDKECNGCNACLAKQTDEMTIYTCQPNDTQCGDCENCNDNGECETLSCGDCAACETGHSCKTCEDLEMLCCPDKQCATSCSESDDDDECDFAQECTDVKVWFQKVQGILKGKSFTKKPPECACCEEESKKLYADGQCVSCTSLSSLDRVEFYYDMKYGYGFCCPMTIEEYLRQQAQEGTLLTESSWLFNEASDLHEVQAIIKKYKDQLGSYEQESLAADTICSKGDEVCAGEKEKHIILLRQYEETLSQLAEEASQYMGYAPGIGCEDRLDDNGNPTCCQLIDGLYGCGPCQSDSSSDTSTTAALHKVSPNYRSAHQGSGSVGAALNTPQVSKASVPKAVAEVLVSHYDTTCLKDLSCYLRHSLTDCPKNAPHYSFELNQCFACQVGLDCPVEKPYQNGQTCVACLTDDHCRFAIDGSEQEQGLYCVAGACVACKNDTDCAPSQKCQKGQCLVTPCQSDTDCPTQTPYCANGTCVGCQTDDQCAGKGIGLCVQGACASCDETHPCKKGLCVAGACLACQSDADCETGMQCRADHTCVACLDNSQCSPRDDKPLCDIVSGQCVSCPLELPNWDADQGRCVGCSEKGCRKGCYCDTNCGTCHSEEELGNLQTYQLTPRQEVNTLLWQALADKMNTEMTEVEISKLKEIFMQAMLEPKNQELAENVFPYNCLNTIIINPAGSMTYDPSMKTLFINQQDLYNHNYDVLGLSKKLMTALRQCGQNTFSHDYRQCLVDMEASDWQAMENLMRFNQYLDTLADGNDSAAKDYRALIMEFTRQGHKGNDAKQLARRKYQLYVLDAAYCDCEPLTPVSAIEQPVWDYVKGECLNTKTNIQGVLLRYYTGGNSPTGVITAAALLTLPDDIHAAFLDKAMTCAQVCKK